MHIHIGELLVIAIVSVVAFAIVNIISFEPKIKQIIYLVMSLIVLLALLQSFGILDSGTSMSIGR